MKKTVFLLMTALMLWACSSPINKPKNLVAEDTMAEIIAELALTDQMSILNASGNMETQTVFVFKKYGITSKQFNDSYKFYLAEPGSLEDIFDEAQEKLKEKDPDAGAYIKKKQKEIQGNPALMR